MIAHGIVIIGVIGSVFVPAFFCNSHIMGYNFPIIQFSSFIFIQGRFI